jgi:peptidoglycan-N-acetylglucosamine deacetylase
VRTALTIDTEQRGHPADPANAERVLAVLAAEHVRATLFVQGRWAGAHPELMQRIAQDGHLIGNHSYYHVPMTMLTDQGVRDSVSRAHDVILATSHVDPCPWFRCPYGDGESDSRVLGLLAKLGYGNVPWDVEADDWRPGRDADDLAETVVLGCRAHGDGARVLLHSWPDATAAALPQIIVRLREAGAELVRLDALAA